MHHYYCYEKYIVINRKTLYIQIINYDLKHNYLTYTLFFFFFLIYFYQLEANHFTTLQWSPSYTDTNQPWFVDLQVFPIPIPLPTSLSTLSLWVFPVHQAQALVSCIQPGLVICFTIDNIHVSMLFSWNIPPSPSPTESKRLYYTSVSLFLFCI